MKILLTLLALACSSCLFARKNFNSPVEPDLVAGVVVGEDAEQVVGRLGAPNEVVQLGRRSAWRYDHTVEKSTGAWLLVGFYNQDTRQDRVWVFFDEEQRVSHVGSTFEARNAEYALPFEDLHDREPSE